MPIIIFEIFLCSSWINWNQNGCRSRQHVVQESVSHFFSLVGDILFSKQNTQAEWPTGEGPSILQKWYSPNFLVEAVETPHKSAILTAHHPCFSSGAWSTSEWKPHIVGAGAASVALHSYHLVSESARVLEMPVGYTSAGLGAKLLFGILESHWCSKHK